MNKAAQNYRLQMMVASIGVLLFAAKFLAYYRTNSVAVLSDALESIVNVLAGFIGLYSFYIATKPRDIDHPYGHGKAEFISAAAEGTLILSSGLLIGYEALRAWWQKSSIAQLDFGMLLIGITALVNFALGWYCQRIGQRNNSLGLQATGKHLQTDTYSSLGIIAALLLMRFFHWQWLDVVVGLLLSVYILFTGYQILRKSLGVIMDETDKALLDRLIALLSQNRKENWVDLHNLRTIQYGNVLHVDCHLTVPWYLNVHEAHQAIDELNQLIGREFGEQVEMFVHTDGCLDFSCRICQKQHCQARKFSFEQRIEWTAKNLFDNQKHGLNKIV